jgi:hypothetical protein
MPVAYAAGPDDVSEAVKEAIKSARAVVGEDVKNTVNINNVNINNPKFSLPSGTLAYIGIAGAAGTGMIATASLLKKSAIPIPAKLGAMGLMALAGGTAASVANGLNTAIQKSITSDNSNKPNSGPSDPGSFTNVPSMIDENKDFIAIMDVLNGNLIIHICILGFIWCIACLFVANKIVNKQWELRYIKNIFGQRIHAMVVKSFHFTSKSNNLFIGLCVISIILSNVIAFIISLFFIGYRKTMASMVLGSSYKSGVLNSLNYQDLSIEFNLERVLLFLYINSILHACIFIIIGSLALLFISNRVIKNRWELKWIDTILSKYIYRLIIKFLTLDIFIKYINLFTSVGIVLIILISIITLWMSDFLIDHIEMISVIIQNSK